MIQEERIVVRTGVFWNTFGIDGSVEHAAEGDSIDITGMDAKSNDTTCVLVHHHKYPVALQQNGFATKQVYAPETILGVPEEGQPRRPIATGRWLVMDSQDTSYDIFINIDVERFIDLLCDCVGNRSVDCVVSVLRWLGWVRRKDPWGQAASAAG